jgi:hypothetical protein
MDLVLDPALSQTIFGGRYGRRLLEVVGLQSLRFATLNLPSPEAAMGQLKSMEDFIQTLASDGLAEVLLRTETLSQQLHLMCDGVYGDIIADPIRARRYLETGSVKNESIDLGLRPEALSRELRLRVQRRESMFFDLLGYERYVPEADDV